MKNLMKKTFTVAAIALVSSAISFAYMIPKAGAQMSHRFDRTINRSVIRHDNFRHDNFRRNNFRHNDNIFRNRNIFRADRFRFNDLNDRRIIRHHFPIRFRANRDFFVEQQLFTRFPIFQNTIPDFFIPREFVVMDRNDMNNAIVIQNSLTGPFSVNRAVITVDSDFFDRLMNDFNLDQNINVRVDTGNNVVEFNTLTGTISTGDVNISIQ
jgi:hypothetical protein